MTEQEFNLQVDRMRRVWPYDWSPEKRKLMFGAISELDNESFIKIVDHFITERNSCPRVSDFREEMLRYMKILNNDQDVQAAETWKTFTELGQVSDDGLGKCLAKIGCKTVKDVIELEKRRLRFYKKHSRPDVPESELEIAQVKFARYEGLVT